MRLFIDGKDVGEATVIGFRPGETQAVIVQDLITGRPKQIEGRPAPDRVAFMVTSFPTIQGHIELRKDSGEAKVIHIESMNIVNGGFVFTALVEP
jgi:hypothetical protein